MRNTSFELSSTPSPINLTRPLPLFPVTTVWSWPRSPEVLRAQRQKQRGTVSEADFEGIVDAAVLGVPRLQEEAGADIVTDGEQRRDKSAIPRN